MDSIELIRHNLTASRDRVLARVEDMREHATVFATPNGGAHTLWVLGHLATVEGLVVHRFLRGADNPLAAWEPIFDGDDVSAERDDYPAFDEVLSRCRAAREDTLARLDAMSEDDLDRPSGFVPDGWEDTFGTARLCLQYVADHWLMHRGNLAAARRAAGIDRMWV